MTPAEIANVKKLIREIKSKLYELENAVSKTPQKQFGFPKSGPQAVPRKRNIYRDSEKGNK